MFCVAACVHKACNVDSLIQNVYSASNVLWRHYVVYFSCIMFGFLNL